MTVKTIKRNGQESFGICMNRIIKRCARGEPMGKWKAKLAQMSSNHIELNRKSLQLKHSWDEVAKMIHAEEKKKKSK